MEDSSEEEEYGTSVPPQKQSPVVLHSIPKTKYGDLLEKQRKREREQEETSAPPKKRAKKNTEPPPLATEQDEEEMNQYLEQRTNTQTNMKQHLWSGYVRLCQAADTLVGQPSEFPQVIAESPDIRSCFELCLDSGSFGAHVKDIDPLHLLLFSTAALMMSCKRSDSGPSPVHIQQPKQPEVLQTNDSRSSNDFDYNALFSEQ